MSKASVQDVISLGFNHVSFSLLIGDNEINFEPFVKAILDENVSTIKDIIGDTAYESASYLDDVKIIEKYMAAKELLMRRGNIVLGNASNKESRRGEAEVKRADRYDKLIKEKISSILEKGGTSSVATAAIISSHFDT